MLPVSGKISGAHTVDCDMHRVHELPKNTAIIFDTFNDVKQFGPYPAEHVWVIMTQHSKRSFL